MDNFTDEEADDFIEKAQKIYQLVMGERGEGDIIPGEESRMWALALRYISSSFCASSSNSIIESLDKILDMGKMDCIALKLPYVKGEKYDE